MYCEAMPFTPSVFGPIMRVFSTMSDAGYCVRAIDIVLDVHNKFDQMRADHNSPYADRDNDDADDDEVSDEQLQKAFRYVYSMHAPANLSRS